MKIVQELVKLADSLDRRGLCKEADMVDRMSKIAVQSIRPRCIVCEESVVVYGDDWVSGNYIAIPDKKGCGHGHLILKSSVSDVYCPICGVSQLEKRCECSPESHRD